MIGLDTNILVRYLAQDDPEQSAIATEVMERRLSSENRGFVSLVAMVELVWVLTRSYRIARADIAAIIRGLLEVDRLVIEQDQAVFTAMCALADGTGGFADVLIAQIGTQAGCAHTLTFDRKAARLPGFAPP